MGNRAGLEHVYGVVYAPQDRFVEAFIDHRLVRGRAGTAGRLAYHDRWTVAVIANSDSRRNSRRWVSALRWGARRSTCGSCSGVGSRSSLSRAGANAYCDAQWEALEPNENS